jgi:acetoin utilization deacetylase AcuC-like enzyme
MTTLLVTHPSSLEHDTGHGHPERPDRLRAVLGALSADEFAPLLRREASRAETAAVALAHRREYVDALLDAVPREGRVRIDPDTVMSPASGDAALFAVGAVVTAVDAVIAGEAENAFCAVRPPGHHATPARGMGFCLFNNVAVGVAHLRSVHGLRRAAVVDFDVHHGNGTQAMFERDPDVLFASTHEYPLYPGTGAAEERGVGNVFNVPLASGSGSAEFRAGVERVILPALRAFKPEFVLVSAGFDAHVRDPLASLRFEDEDYAWVTARLREAAAELCGGRLVSSLEGGYDLTALAASAAAHVRELMRSG